MIRGYVLDAGFFIGIERRTATAVKLLQTIRHHNVPLVTSANVVAQIWRGGSGAQVPLVFVLRSVEIVNLTYVVAKEIGVLLGHSGTSDPTDAHVVQLAQERDWIVVTSDPQDLRKIDQHIELEIL